MSAAPSLAPAAETGSRRNSPRYPVDVSLDVITLRSGIPDSIPGRCTDISEAGIGAAIAGQLTLDQRVAVELRLPHVAVPLRARAIVRHLRHLHCGLQFVNLSAEQREMIRYWAHRAVAQPPMEPIPQPVGPAVEAPTAAQLGNPERSRRIRIRKLQVLMLLLCMLAFAALAWWYWQRAWSELEKSASVATERLADEARSIGGDQSSVRYSNFSACAKGVPCWSLGETIGSPSSCQSIFS